MSIGFCVDLDQQPLRADIPFPFIFSEFSYLVCFQHQHNIPCLVCLQHQHQHQSSQLPASQSGPPQMQSVSYQYQPAPHPEQVMPNSQMQQQQQQLMHLQQQAQQFGGPAGNGSMAFSTGLSMGGAGNNSSVGRTNTDPGMVALNVRPLQSVKPGGSGTNPASGQQQRSGPGPAFLQQFGSSVAVSSSQQQSGSPRASYSQQAQGSANSGASGRASDNKSFPGKQTLPITITPLVLQDYQSLMEFSCCRWWTSKRQHRLAWCTGFIPATAERWAGT